MAWPCGEAPPGTSSAGSPTPPITPATRAWIGFIDAAIRGASPAAAKPEPSQSVTPANKPDTRFDSRVSFSGCQQFSFWLFRVISSYARAVVSD